MTNNLLEDILTIDCNYLYPEFAASYLLNEDDSLVIIETNTAKASNIILSAIKDNDFHPGQVEYIVVTHAHLDHSGGAWSLMEQCKNATLLVHPRAARHLINPEKLVKGSKSVYGEEKFNELYGEIRPIESNRVKEVEDGMSIKLGSRYLNFIHTEGHARHHLCMFDSNSNGIFTGDSMGLAFPYLQTGTKPFIFPSSSPVDFDPKEAKLSIYKILDTGANKAFLTHFGHINDIDIYGEMMYSYIDDYENILKQAVENELRDSELEKYCLGQMETFMYRELESREINITDEIKTFLKMDIEINAMGLAFKAAKMME